MSILTRSEYEKLRAAVTSASASIPRGSITVGGNVGGSIVTGNDNVFADNYVVYEVQEQYGAVINTHPAPYIKRREMNQQPPRKLSEFVGRSSELAKLTKIIGASETAIVYGHDGIGKTALVKQAANSKSALAMPDGVIYIQGIEETGQVLGPHDIIQHLFDVLFESNPPLKITAPTARVAGLKDIIQRLFDALFKSNSPRKVNSSTAGTYLSNTQPLIVLDQIEFPVADLGGLPDLFPKGALVIASRNAPIGDSFQPIQLSPLARKESIQILVSKSGVGLDETTRILIDEICNLLGDIPLAISQIASILRDNRFTLQVVADRLKAIQPPSQNNIQAALERSYGLVYAILDRKAQEVLVHVAAAPGNSVDRRWLESIAGSKETINALESFELLQANSPRLRLPEGVRQVIQSIQKDLGKPRESLLHYLLGQVETRGTDPDVDEFMADELGNILGLLQWSLSEKRWSDVIKLGRAIDPYLTLHGLWDAWEIVLQNVLRAGRSMKDKVVQAWVYHQLGTREVGVGRLMPSFALLFQALQLRVSSGDNEGAIYTLHNLEVLISLVPPPPPQPPDDMRKPFLKHMSEVMIQHGSSNWIILAILLSIAAIIIAIIMFGYRLELDKIAETKTYSTLGDVINYRYTVRNVGFIRLAGPIIVTDDKTQATCLDVRTTGNKDDLLDRNEAITCTATYTITQADINRGSVTNTAKARAGDVISKSKSLRIIYQPPNKGTGDTRLTLTKSANPTTYSDVNQIITYTYEITNGGKDGLEGPTTVTDNKTQVTCPDDKDGFLDPGEKITCTATYTITQADNNRGSVTNTATAFVSQIPSNSVSITINKTALTLTKNADTETYDTVGQKVTYTYNIRNIGNTVLPPTQFSITDDHINNNLPFSCGPDNTALDPNDSVTCSASYTITQADIDNGSVTNTAVASGGGASSNLATFTIKGPERVPRLLLTKRANPTEYYDVGQTITYTYVITNEGNVTLSSPFAITDDHINSVNCDSEKNKLAPNETVSCTGFYTIEQADFEPKSVTNEATASVEYDGYPVSSSRVTTTITCPYPPEGWVSYTVESGETLYHISTWYPGVSVPDLQRANCMGLSIVIVEREMLYVPRTPPLATISGFIHDTEGQPLKDTPVTLINTDTGETQTKKTDEDGSYQFSDLTSGNYRIFQVPFLNLRRGDHRTQNFVVIPVTP